jgi:hypothetical protein
VTRPLAIALCVLAACSSRGVTAPSTESRAKLRSSLPGATIKQTTYTTPEGPVIGDDIDLKSPVRIHGCLCGSITAYDDTFDCHLSAPCKAAGYSFEKGGTVFWYYGAPKLSTLAFDTLEDDPKTMKFGSLTCGSNVVEFHPSGSLKECFVEAQEYQGIAWKAATLTLDEAGKIKRAWILEDHVIDGKTYEVTEAGHRLDFDSAGKVVNDDVVEIVR